MSASSKNSNLVPPTHYSACPFALGPGEHAGQAEEGSKSGGREVKDGGTERSRGGRAERSQQESEEG